METQINRDSRTRPCYSQGKEIDKQAYLPSPSSSPPPCDCLLGESCMQMKAKVCWLPAYHWAPDRGKGEEEKEKEEEEVVRDRICA